jgi:hypothetical protein
MGKKSNYLLSEVNMLIGSWPLRLLFNQSVVRDAASGCGMTSQVLSRSTAAPQLNENMLNDE